MNTAYYVKKLEELAEECSMEHGSTNGKADCPYRDGAIEFLKRNGHACRRCLAHERLWKIEELLS